MLGSPNSKPHKNSGLGQECPLGQEQEPQPIPSASPQLLLSKMEKENCIGFFLETTLAVFQQGLGSYCTDTGTFIIECSGKLNRPCVFRCVEEHKCWFQGVVEIKANEAWLWGVRISDMFVQFTCN